MFKIVCDKCKGPLSVNDQKTVEDYLENMKFEVIKEGSLANNEIPLYMYYACIECGAQYKLTPIEFEKKVREHMADIALNIKRKNIMEQINPYMIDPDNGLEYCGCCLGYDNKGNCLVDIIKQCPLLKEKRKNEELLTRRSNSKELKPV